ncbi:transglutaminase family protein [Microbacterium hominis]|uniref:Transglutaminase family protein n=1 Tax=Microbacterium hominis TaxID=162426 RepID=A0A7D4PZ57_9MICO|nr:transglutaminase family protein [Microbacterium hominis]QKJ18092.1 transglutaminase family protein [Microbacterium hominis]
MKYVLSHRTEYTYDKPVRNSLGVHHLRPRQLPWQSVASHAVTLEPVPGDLAPDTDYYGNSVTYFHVTAPHERLVIDAVSEVTVERPVYDEAALAVPWENARPMEAATGASAWAAVEYALESPRVAHIPEAAAYAAESLTPGRPLGEAATDLMQRIHRDFDYDTKATTVTSTVADAMRKRAGVCQDFAHVALACLRSHGLAARYVSGYLATQPPPGKERIVGADASHAWLAVWVPPVGTGAGQWLAIDPTNNQWANDRYITVAWGRDYGDVSPVRGIIWSKAKRSTLRVSVDVAPVPVSPSVA